MLDTVGDRTIGWQTEAQQGFKDALLKVAPNLSTSSAGPYRRPEIYPPVSFSNVDEVDLHYQSEQITTPNWTAHAPDFYARPGKPSWIHPELHNDTGTGEMILPMSWLALMRGASGIGAAGDIPFPGSQLSDSRSGHAGTLSVYRALNTVAQQYGPWLTTLENSDRVAIVVSYRQIKMDAWGGVGGRYFTRLWEAYQSCLYARQPATFLYTEDVKPDTLSRFKALLLVGQQYEMEPALISLLSLAKQKGLTIFTDNTCRESLVKEYKPLGIAFDHIEKLNGFNNDSAFWDFPEALLANVPALEEKLAPVLAPLAIVNEPEVLVSMRSSGDARFLWVVNNTHSPLEPSLLWRLNNAAGARPPQLAQVKLPLQKSQVVYDVFTGKKVSADFTADLRYTQARLYAIMPRAIEKLTLKIPAKLVAGQIFNWSAEVPGITAKLPLQIVLRDATGTFIDERYTTTGSGTMRVPSNALLPVTFFARELISGQTAGATRVNSDLRVQFPERYFGPRLRDIAISPDGATALLNAFNWGENLYTIDLAAGKMRRSGNIGQYFSYAPMATRDGFALQAYDLNTAEGYQLYRLDATGQPTRRFALPGLPSRLVGWAFPILNDRINNFTLAPDGSWVAGAGDLALVVWTADGRELWKHDWSAKSRVAPRILALDNDRLLVASGMTLTAYQAKTGETIWTVTPDQAGEIIGLCASADGHTVAARASTRSGRVFVIRDGKLIGTLPTAADDAVLTPDSAQVVVTTGNDLKWYTSDGNLQWVYKGDAILRSPRLSNDGKRLAVGSELGTFYMCDLTTGKVNSRDLGALPVTSWLPDGGYVVATWMGKVYRFSAEGKELWQLSLQGERSLTPTLAVKIPNTRYTGWSNAEATPLPLTDNLLASNKVSIKALAGTSNIALQHPLAKLFDGDPTAPDSPWMRWTDSGMIDSGWRGSFTLEFDASPANLRLTAITFIEDAQHPESWLHDARLEYWDTDQWVLAQYLTADAAIHSHKLAKPIVAAKFRLACPYGVGWPVGNLRLGEIVLHGEKVTPE